MTTISKQPDQDPGPNPDTVTLQHAEPDQRDRDCRRRIADNRDRQSHDQRQDDDQNAERATGVEARKPDQAWLAPAFHAAKLRNNPGDDAVELLALYGLQAEPAWNPHGSASKHQLYCDEQDQYRRNRRESRRHRKGIGYGEEDQKHAESTRTDSCHDLEERDAIAGCRCGKPCEDFRGPEQAMIPC